MHRRPSIVLILLLLATSVAFAASVSEQDALNKALQFQHGRNSSKLRGSPVVQLVAISPDVTAPAPLNPAFYVFDVGEDQGFVIVSGETGTKSVLAYSDHGRFPIEGMPDNLKAWLGIYEQEIWALRTTANHNQDSIPSAATPLKSAAPVVPPLLGTTNWSQLNPFNVYCPWDSPYKTHSAVGCVALAMGQIMAYHRWPIKPKGPIRYYVDNMGLQALNLDTVSYDWERMSWSVNPSLPALQDTLVARMLYHAGCSINMQYSALGSAADVANVGPAMVEHFDYDPDIQYYKRKYFTTESWDAMICQELDAERPVLYAAFCKEVGHVFICDGYDTNHLFHINWGWGGNGNGYFELSSLNSGYPDMTGAPDGFSKDQSVLIRIQRPDLQNKISYSLCIPDGTLQTKALSFFRNDVYSVKFDYKNIGTNTFAGYFGLGYYDSDNQLRLLDKTSTTLQTIYSGSIRTYAPENVTLPSDLGDGLYGVFAVYRPKDSINWTILSGSSTLHLQLSGDKAKFMYGSSYALLELKAPINIVHQLYQNQQAEVYVTFMNYFKAYNATLMIDLYSQPNAQFLGTIYQGTHQIRSGSIQTIKLKTTLRCPPGNYSLVVRSNSLYEQNFVVRMEPFTCNNLNIHVNPPPSSPVLALTDSMRLTQIATPLSSDSLSLKATITNKGGFSNVLLIGLVYSKEGSACLDTLSAQEIVIDSTERTTVYVHGTVQLPDGAYQVSLCEKKDGVCVPLGPTSFSSMPFNIGNPVANADLAHVYWHLSNDDLFIEGSEPIQDIRIFTLSGIPMMHVENQRSLHVRDLPKGVYFLKVCRGKSVFFDKFLKK